MSESREYRPINIPSYNQFKCRAVEGYRKADLHLHTRWTDGTVSPKKMVELAVSTGIDAIAITDHNTSVPSDIAIDYATQNNLPIEVIRGMEVSSKDGHVLALNLEGTIKPNMPLEETIKEIHRQRGFAIIAHPNLKRTSSVHLELIRKIIDSDDPELYMDGIEIFNASEARMHRVDKLGIFFREDNSNVRRFVEANIHNPKLGALLGNTDGHTRRIGYGITVYKCGSVLDAIRNRDTVPMASNTPFLRDFSESAQMVYSVIRSHLTGKI